MDGLKHPPLLCTGRIVRRVFREKWDAKGSCDCSRVVPRYSVGNISLVPGLAAMSRLAQPEIMTTHIPSYRVSFLVSIRDIGVGTLVRRRLMEPGGSIFSAPNGIISRLMLLRVKPKCACISAQHRQPRRGRHDGPGFAAKFPEAGAHGARGARGARQYMPVAILP